MSTTYILLLDLTDGEIVKIINFRRKEELITTADGPKLNEEGRHVFTDRTKQQIKNNNENYWKLEKVSGIKKI